MEPKFLTLNNFEIAYFDNEKQANTTLLFIHGNSLNIQLFRNQLNNPALNKYRIVAPDLPGHGASAKSDNPEKDYGILNFIDILQQLVKELNLKNIVLVGHSLGGHIAIHLMSALQKSKIAVKGIAIMGTPPLTLPPVMDQAFLPNPAMGLAFKGELSNDEMEMLTSAFVHRETAFEMVKNSIKTADPLVRPMIGQSIATQLAEDESLILKNADVPLAVLHGKKDELVNVQYISELGLQLWENNIHYIADAGHCTFLENPAGFNAKLADFCREINK